MKIEKVVSNSGFVGRKGSIVLPVATRRRYGLADGALFISEERKDGILIRPARAVPTNLSELNAAIQAGLDDLDAGRIHSGDDVQAELRELGKKKRAKNKG